MKKTLLRTAVAAVIATAVLGTVTPAFADGSVWDSHIAQSQFCADHVSVSMGHVSDDRVCAEHLQIDG